MSEREAREREPRITLNRETGQLVSAEPLCATADGKLVSCDDPSANTQVAGAGTPIDPKLVKIYGIKATREAEAKAEDAKEAVVEEKVGDRGEHPTQLPAPTPEHKPSKR